MVHPADPLALRSCLGRAVAWLRARSGFAFSIPC